MCSTDHLVWAGPVHQWILVGSWPNLARIPTWACTVVEFVSAPAVNKDTQGTNPQMTDVCYRHIKTIVGRCTTAVVVQERKEWEKIKTKQISPSSPPPIQLFS